MNMEARQLPFPLPVPHQYAPEDFVVSPANEMAYRLVTQWPDWSSYAMILHGPEASGTTHLSHVWQAKSHAARLNIQADSPLPPVEEIQKHTALVLDHLTIDSSNMEWLFHVLNLYAEHRAGLLLVMQTWPLPDTLSILPDLRSRLLALPVAAIASPDDSLLSAVLHKCFSDRQLRPAPDVIPFLLPRIERSFTAARHIVAAIDSAALADHRDITLPLARRVWDQQHSSLT